MRSFDYFLKERDDVKNPHQHMTPASERKEKRIFN